MSEDNICKKHRRISTALSAISLSVAYQHKFTKRRLNIGKLPADLGFEINEPSFAARTNSMKLGYSSSLNE